MLIIAHIIVVVTIILFVGLKTDTNLYAWFQTFPLTV